MCYGSLSSLIFDKKKAANFPYWESILQCTANYPPSFDNDIATTSSGLLRTAAATATTTWIFHISSFIYGIFPTVEVNSHSFLFCQLSHSHQAIFSTHFFVGCCVEKFQTNQFPILVLVSSIMRFPTTGNPTRME